MRWGPASEDYAATLRRATLVDNHLSPARLKSEACWFCTVPSFPIRTFDFGVADHAWLEQDQKRQAELADSWLEQLLGEAWWRRADEGAQILNRRLDWRVTYAAHLSQHRKLAELLEEEAAGVEAVYRWAEIPQLEAATFELSLLGWTEEAIAGRLDTRVGTIRHRLYSARARLRDRGLPVPEDAYSGPFRQPPERVRAQICPYARHARTNALEGATQSTCSQKAS